MQRYFLPSVYITGKFNLGNMQVFGLVENTIRIVVADDVPSARKIVRRLLEKMGFNNIVEAINGQDAFNKVKEAETSLVISDWEMPDMHGIDLLQALKADPTCKAIPFILITSASKKEEVVTALNSGVTNYIAKPFTYVTLSNKVEAVIKKTREVK